MEEAAQHPPNQRTGEGGDCGVGATAAVQTTVLPPPHRSLPSRRRSPSRCRRSSRGRAARRSREAAGRCWGTRGTCHRRASRGAAKAPVSPPPLARPLPPRRHRHISDAARPPRTERCFLRAQPNWMALAAGASARFCRSSRHRGQWGCAQRIAHACMEQGRPVAIDDQRSTCMAGEHRRPANLDERELSAPPAPRRQRGVQRGRCQTAMRARFR